MSHDTLRRLLKQAQDPSDRTSWECLVNLYTPLLHSWLRRESLQPQDADDVVQEVLVVLACTLPKFQHNGKKGAFRAWLRGILLNRLREFRRAAKTRERMVNHPELLERMVNRLEESHRELTRSGDADFDVSIVHRLLERIRGDFQPTTWRAFERTVLENADATTVAAELGISLESVYTAKSRVLRRLRQEQKEIPT